MMKRKFGARSHMAPLEEQSRKWTQLSAVLDESLYDRLIQFGAHPNEKSISGNLKLEHSASQTQLLQVYLQGDGHQLDHWIHTANQVGILILKIFEKIHVKRFSDLGVGPKIDQLADSL